MIRKFKTATPEQIAALPPPTVKIHKLEMDDLKVQMFSKARNVSLCDSEINNVGGNLTIDNHNVLLQLAADSELVQVPLMQSLSFTADFKGIPVNNLGLLDPTIFSES